MARSVGSVIHEVIAKLQSQMDGIKPQPNLSGYTSKSLSQYQEGLKDGLNRAIRALEQVDTTE